MRQHSQDVQFALIRQEDGDLLPVKQGERVQRLQVQVGGGRGARNVDNLVGHNAWYYNSEIKNFYYHHDDHNINYCWCYYRNNYDHKDYNIHRYKHNFKHLQIR